MVARIKERERLNDLEAAKVSDFVVVYGRRRVGKTFLIREHFAQKFAFYAAGLANTSTRKQLLNFHTSIQKFNTKNLKIETPKNWYEAFQSLEKILAANRCKKKVIFIDELPWFDTSRSGFLSALEHFWNSWASARTDILLITCGSAASWMITKILNNKGGLHNRVTQRMKIEPFTLSECKEYLASKNIQYNHYQMVEMYSILGGIPYYLNLLKKGLSITQSIDELCFSDDGELKNEFNNLYASLFKKAESHVQIILALATKTKGLTRKEIIDFSKIPNGGGTTKVLDELVECGFIRRYFQFDKKNKDCLYQLVDFYSLFYLKFIKNNKLATAGYWIKAIDNPAKRAWSGYAFEQVCLMHTTEIKQKLGISGVLTTESSWRSKDAENGVQIDLLIDRRDQVVNLFEIKHSISEFVIDKKYDMEIRNKIGTFQVETKTRKAVWMTMITTFGLQKNMYAMNIQNELTLEDLF